MNGAIYQARTGLQVRFQTVGMLYYFSYYGLVRMAIDLTVLGTIVKVFIRFLTSQAAANVYRRLVCMHRTSPDNDFTAASNCGRKAPLPPQEGERSSFVDDPATGSRECTKVPSTDQASERAMSTATDGENTSVFCQRLLSTNPTEEDQQGTEMVESS
jgi:hypothetical protein